jgi:hypothetical protein
MRLTWGAASETVPKFISRSDPAAQWTGAHKGHAFFAYADNYLIDLKAAIIVDVEATRAIRQAEVGAARTMIERTEDCLGLCPERLAADSAYGSAEMLGWLVNERAIEPHIPVFDKSARDDGTFSRGDFNYHQEVDIYVCLAGKVQSIFARSAAGHRSILKARRISLRRSLTRRCGVARSTEIKRRGGMIRAWRISRRTLCFAKSNSLSKSKKGPDSEPFFRFKTPPFSAAVCIGIRKITHRRLGL